MLSSLKKPSASTAISVLCLLLLIMLFRCSDSAGEHMKRGMAICFNTLIPSLFPFMVISELLVRSGACAPIARLMRRPMELIFGISGECASALLLGIVCGFPVGAKAAASLYSRGEITKEECEHLLSFCNLPSPPFMIFAVGEGMFGSKNIGILLYCTVLFSGLLCGALMRPKRITKQIVNATEPSASDNNTLSVFASSVASAAYSVISVSAFVTFFTCAVGTFSSMLGADPDSPWRALIFSFFELTSGSAACSSLEEAQLGIILAAAAGGWSGLSVLLQICSLTRTDTEEPSLLPYIKAKALCAAICSVITALFTYLFPSLTEGINTAKDAFSDVISYPRTFVSAVNIIFIFTSVICLCKLLDRRRKI